MMRFLQVHTRLIIDVCFKRWCVKNYFEGLYFSEKLNIKNFKIKNMDNKISRIIGNSLRNKVRGWVEFDFPNPLKPFPTGWENTERIASLYSYIARFWQNLLASLRFSVTSTKRWPIALKMTPVDPPYTPIIMHPRPPGRHIAIDN